MLAGRDIGLGVGVLTMGATWVGGGFINGSAQVGCCGGDGNGDVVAVTWVGVPWLRVGLVKLGFFSYPSSLSSNVAFLFHWQKLRL